MKKILLVMLCAAPIIIGLQAHAAVWHPSPGHTQIPVWPGTPPDAQKLPGPEHAVTKTSSRPQFAGKPVTGVFDVSRPTMTVYAPKGKNTGTAVVVFPGGGFQVLAIDLEGTEICHWLTSIGATCILLKYRVPSAPFSWKCKCYNHGVLATSLPSLQDAQRTLRLVRYHAAKWHINPHKIGVIGFSAGGFLVAETSTDFNKKMYKPVGPADKESDRPDFAIAIYPGHITVGHGLNPNLHFTKQTPPTFVLQAEDAKVDSVMQSLAYYTALEKAGVPAELHIYAKGGHAFGLRRRKGFPITHWPRLVDTWLHTIGMLPD